MSDTEEPNDTKDRKRIAPHTMWNMVREIGVKKQKLLTEARMRKEVMKQIVLQEFGHVVNVHDFENTRIKFKREGVDDQSIVIAWKSCRLEHPGAVLTVAWNTDNTSLCTYRPGETIYKYAEKAIIQTPDTNFYTKLEEKQLHFQLNKPIDTKTAWHTQFWPFVKDMIMMVFKHSMLLATVTSIYGVGNVRITKPIYHKSYEVWLMRMGLGLRNEPGIQISVLQHHHTPIVEIFPDPPMQIDEAKLTTIVTRISRIEIEYDSYEERDFFIVETSPETCWRLRFRFISQPDMGVIMQAVKILKDVGAF